MKKIAIFLSICIWSILTTSCYASPLKVEISLKCEPYHGAFIIATKITNISDTAQKISTYTGAYGWSWVGGSPAIVTGIESCTNNGLGDIVLKPGESYSRDLDVTLSSKAKPGPLTFQMGFNPYGDWVGTRRGVDPKEKEMLKGIIWSNVLTISVEKNISPFLWKVSEELEQKSVREFHSHAIIFKR
jgi:hypothetical protein